MIYEIDMLCKDFKGHNLIEKNIYRIIALNVKGTDINPEEITYTGDEILEQSKDLVIYANIFQDNKLFAREYADISSSLSEEKKIEYNQNIKVEPLTKEEIEIISTEDFALAKEEYTKSKFKSR